MKVQYPQGDETVEVELTPDALLLELAGLRDALESVKQQMVGMIAAVKESEEYRGLQGSYDDWKEQAEDLEATIKQIGLEMYRTSQNKKPAPYLGIREGTSISYDPEAVMQHILKRIATGDYDPWAYLQLKDDAVQRLIKSTKDQYERDHGKDQKVKPPPLLAAAIFATEDKCSIASDLSKLELQPGEQSLAAAAWWYTEYRVLAAREALEKAESHG